MTSTTDGLVDGVLAGDRTAVGRALTLVESQRVEDRTTASDLLAKLLPRSGSAHRVGITGVPGVGKSTFIDALGTNLTQAGRRVAVLAVDPTSTVTGGSILGDKTRMPRLANDNSAFVRPSPSTGTLGGVTRTTRESMVVLEAAGYDVVLVETVGIGQSETAVATMVDFFLVLMLPGAGDELQGIKKGVLELADMIAVNKADGDNETSAREAASDYSAALRLTRPSNPNWNPPVVTCSGLTGTGLATLWGSIEDHRSTMASSGAWEERRSVQQLSWMWSLVEDRLIAAMRENPDIHEVLDEAERSVREGRATPTVTAEHLVQIHLDLDT
ncbi:MAG: methylmalonyl Co-A mutase-associated GTPase MeaB [Actinomycetota bacterium]|nr:methylmalonyl Co-A mutase-associated GTPase MeaB [Actinomycetota bacterium]